MASPLLAFQGDLDPRAFAFQDLAAECKDKRLNIGKHDGSRSGLPKEGLQGLLVTFLHKYMIAKCASVSHACWCDVMPQSPVPHIPSPRRIDYPRVMRGSAPQATGGCRSLGYGGLSMTDWLLNVDRVMTRFWRRGHWLEASHVVPPLPSVAVGQRLAKCFTPGPQQPPATVPDGHIWRSVAKSAAAWSGGRHG